MRVYFLRHGIAQDRELDLPDAERNLVEKGIQKTIDGAKRFKALGVAPTIIYTSPLNRAYQTAEIVARELGCELVKDERLAEGFHSRNLGDLIKEHGAGDLMVVGHEPSLSMTISNIISGGDIIMKKGGLARVDLQRTDPPRGELVWLLPPHTQ